MKKTIKRAGAVALALAASGSAGAQEPADSGPRAPLELYLKGHATGDGELAKIELDYPAVKFTDFMTLLRIDGEWKIMSKVYHGEQRK